MKPRYSRSWQEEANEYFAGYANELDVWVEFPSLENGTDKPLVLVVGPPHLQIGHFDYDCYEAVGGILDPRESVDLHTTLHDMALIYQIATQEGVFEWTEQPEPSSLIATDTSTSRMTGGTAYTLTSA